MRPCDEYGIRQSDLRDAIPYPLPVAGELGAGNGAGCAPGCHAHGAATVAGSFPARRSSRVHGVRHVACLATPFRGANLSMRHGCYIWGRQ